MKTLELNKPTARKEGDFFPVYGIHPIASIFFKYDKNKQFVKNCAKLLLSFLAVTFLGKIYYVLL
jgi:hypothetical protein